jgi:RimJ/RimL family protein N-acetyltransferase
MDQRWIPHPTILHGSIIDLFPVEINNLDQLFQAAADQRIWEFYTGNWSVHKRFLEIYNGSMAMREEGREYPFVIFHKPSQRIIGSTRFLDIAPSDKRLEIGGTWIMPEYWKTAVNLDCKFTLMQFCFESLGVHRVQLKTQHDNIRSRKAIEKIGGIYEGVIREHMLKDNGIYRSSAYFSILKQEWDTKVKADLKEKLMMKLQETS